MKHESRRHRVLPLLMLPALLMAACATATGEEAMTQSELQGEGPFQRFIVRYREGSPPAQDKARAEERLARTAAAASLSPAPVPSWQRRLAVGADVFTLDRPLDRDGALALMQAFNRDPEVEYIEVDRMMGIGPRPAMPMREDD